MVKRPHADHYRLLGVGRQADEDELRAAFRRLARRYHPDVGTSGDAGRFRQIREAYEVLSEFRRLGEPPESAVQVEVRFASPPRSAARPRRDRPCAHLDLTQSGRTGRDRETWDDFERLFRSWMGFF